MRIVQQQQRQRFLILRTSFGGFNVVTLLRRDVRSNQYKHARDELLFSSIMSWLARLALECSCYFAANPRRFYLTCNDVAKLE